MQVGMTTREMLAWLLGILSHSVSLQPDTCTFPKDTIDKVLEALVKHLNAPPNV